MISANVLSISFGLPEKVHDQDLKTLVPENMKSLSYDFKTKRKNPSYHQKLGVLAPEGRESNEESFKRGYEVWVGQPCARQFFQCSRMAWARYADSDLYKALAQTKTSWNLTHHLQLIMKTPKLPSLHSPRCYRMKEKSPCV